MYILRLFAALILHPTPRSRRKIFYCSKLAASLLARNPYKVDRPADYQNQCSMLILLNFKLTNYIIIHYHGVYNFPLVNQAHFMLSFVVSWFGRKWSRFRVPYHFRQSCKKVKNCYREMPAEQHKLRKLLRRVLSKSTYKRPFLFAGVEISLHGIIKCFHKWWMMSSCLSSGELACVALISVSRDVHRFGFVPRVL